MKRPFTIYDLRFAICKKSAKPAAAKHQSSIINHPSQRGVALIITVIMLAVVTFMAITFLAISRRERGAVTTTTDTATAQLAADDALAAAEAQIMANTLAATNPYNFGLLVSTNYINPYGFTAGVASPTNVNYNYYSTGPGPLSLNDFLQNLANLYYSPRPPVFVPIPSAGSNDFRFFLNLNRNVDANGNALYDPNGPVVDGVGIGTETNIEVGDPEWIGVLQHPDQPYGPNNPFVARYAFVAVPIGNALDLNAIHNQALVPAWNYPKTPMNFVDDGYFRNQGVGSWEINLAAFLADLNSHEWLPVPPPDPGYYQYNQYQPGAAYNKGIAFEDAFSLLSYRYDNDYNSLAAANSLFFPTRAANVLPYDNLDTYDVGPALTGLHLSGDNDTTLWPWVGADNTNQFFDLQELYNTSSALFGTFASRLLAIGNAYNLNNSDPTNFYNRYTYYRLLSQMGVDSAPEQGQINLNYSNAFAYFNNYGVVTNITYYPDAETNLIPWTPLQFFTIAADRMLRAYSQKWLTENPTNYLATYGMTTNIGTVGFPTNMPVPFGISDIPVYVDGTNRYTPAVQRVLQLAANMYDAVYCYSNNFVTSGAGYPAANLPSVFRPFFTLELGTNSSDEVYTNVYISGFTQVTNIDQVDLHPSPGYPIASGPLTAPYDLDNQNVVAFLWAREPGPFYVNFYGVPWIIGAKKGFPNFNEFAMESVFQLTRKLQVTRDSTNDTYTSNPDHYHFNQMFNLSVSNQFGVECWNSYSNDYYRPVDIYVTNYFYATLTNDEYFSTSLAFLITNSLSIIPASNNDNGWPGYNPDGSGAPHPAILLSPASFQLPLDTNVTIITNSMYRFNTGGNVQEPWAGSGPYLTTNLAWPFESNVFVNASSSPYFPQPHWWLMTTNYLQVLMVDHASGGIVDYVQLKGPNSVRDLTGEIISNWDIPVVSTAPSGYEFWNTNSYRDSIFGEKPVGLISQLGVSVGSIPEPGNGSVAWLPGHTRDDEEAGFLAFLGYDTGNTNEYVGEQKMSNAVQVPYTPTATVVQHIDWQVNDPLVHYMTNDLSWPGAVPPITQIPDNLTNENGGLGKLNVQYMPWGDLNNTNTSDFTTANAYNLALKDPLVWQSDDWDFPTYKMPTVGWLGRVHRGTPWQTVYLKSPDILQEAHIIINNGVTNYTYLGTNYWEQWTGDSSAAGGEYYDAINTAPSQDRLLFDLFTTAPNANATRGQLSVNVGASDPTNPQTGLAAWSALLSGVEVLANNAANPPVQHNGSVVDFTAFPIDPAGPAGPNSKVGQIVEGINQTRLNANNADLIFNRTITGIVTNETEIPATFANADGLAGAFEHVGDILSVPQLSDQSPFLNLNANGVVEPVQLQNGISDEMYEWLPQQVMSLLRVSGTPQSPMRYVIYCYGQALKPAPNGIYTGSGAYFGMITNYQVVAESATRALVNFGSTVTNVITTNADNNWISVPVVTNNTAQIKQYNVLPPN